MCSCAAKLSDWSCRYVHMNVYMSVYMWSKVTAVLCLSAHKYSRNLVRCCLFAFTVHAVELFCYSWWVLDQTLFLGILFLRTCTVSPRGAPGPVITESVVRSGRCILVVYSSDQPMRDIHASWVNIRSGQQRVFTLCLCVQHTQCTGYVFYELLFYL